MEVLFVEGLLARQWGKLDLDLFRGEAEPLLELREDTESLARFDRLFATLKKRLA